MYQVSHRLDITNNHSRFNTYEPSLDSLFNSSLNYNAHVSTIPGSAEVSQYFVNPKEGKHPLTKFNSPPHYVQGYYDPSFESTEYDRCEFRGNLPRAIISGKKDLYNVMVKCTDPPPDEFNHSDTHVHQYKLNDNVLNYDSTISSRKPAGSNFSSNTIKEPFTAVMQNIRGQQNNIIEHFDSPIMDEADYMYLEALKTRAVAVCNYLQSNKQYHEWMDNWKLLSLNLRNGSLFQRLDDSDADIAYVVNKGEQVKFRIRDKKKYIPINVYQYVLYHEMAHMSTEEKQHTPFFCKLLNIISLAAFECGFIDLKKLTYSYYKTNGAPILCKASMKEEIIDGANWLLQSNPKSRQYYNGIIEAVGSA